MTFGAVVSFLLTLARALPALEQLFRAVVRERDQERAREAANRLEQKNAAADAAVDAPFQVKGEPGPGA